MAATGKLVLPAMRTHGFDAIAIDVRGPACRMTLPIVLADAVAQMA